MVLFKNRYFQFVEISPVIIECTVFKVEATDEEIYELMAQNDKFLADNIRRITIFRLKDMKLMSADHRILIGNWTKANEEIIKKLTIGIAYMTESIISTMVLNMIFMVQKPVFPHIITKNESEAQQWIKDMLDKEPI